MGTERVTAPHDPNEGVREMAKKVNALARRIDSAYERMAVASNRIGSETGGFWSAKADRQRRVREARKIQTAEMDLSRLVREHAIALATYKFGIGILAAKELPAPASPRQLADWARQVALGELTLVAGTINNETVATYEWSGDDIDRLKAALQREGDDAGRGVLAAVGRPPIIITEGELPTFEKALEKAEAARNQVVVDAVVEAQMAASSPWAPPQPAQWAPPQPTHAQAR